MHVVPSLIHYSATEILIGDQVLSRGLAEHKDTIYWMKRGIAQRSTKSKKTAQGHKSPAEAGTDFLERLLNRVSNQVSFADDEFTFTAPTEAFDTFRDWLQRLCESLGIRRLRMLDEPTACVLGYHGAAGKDDHFVVFDFGCGTLDVSAVRIDLASPADHKAVQLGQAGRDLGGWHIDRWLADDFAARHQLNDYERRELGPTLARKAEAAKIAISDPGQDAAELTVISQVGRKSRVLQTNYHRVCIDCLQGRPGAHADPRDACLGCLLLRHDFLKSAHETLERALENAAVHAGMRRSSVVKLLVTGGTSLVPCVRQMLEASFNGRVDYQSPFDAVARGACRGIVVPILQHDYALESYNRAKKVYEFEPLFEMGTEFPTPPEAPVRKWGTGSRDGQTEIEMKIFEVSQVTRRDLEKSLVDVEGRLQDETKVTTERSYVCLNRDNPTFILAEPPVNLKRDSERFLCLFSVDGHRRLLVTVLDNLTGKTLLKDHPVVRL